MNSGEKDRGRAMKLLLPVMAAAAIHYGHAQAAPSALQVNQQLVAQVVPLGQTGDPMEGNLAWSPDGKRIAFLKGYPVDFKSPLEENVAGEAVTGEFTMGLTVGDLWIADADGENRQQLTKCDTTVPYEKAEYVLGVRWSPDGKTLAYPSGTMLDGGQLVLHDVATGAAKRLPYGLLFSAVVSWSPDSQTLAFGGASWKAIRAVAEDDDADSMSPTLSVVGVDGRGYRKLFEQGEMTRDRGWSPDGKQVLFELYRSMDGPGELCLIGVDGKGAKRITRDFGGSAAWSPDGRSVAYTVSGDAPGLWVVTIAGGKRQQLVKGEVRSVHWPQQGSGLFYDTPTDDGGRAWLLRSRDKTCLQLTTAGDVCELHPSPDGKRVAVVVTEGEGQGTDVRSRNGLYILTLKGEAVEPG